MIKAPTPTEMSKGQSDNTNNVTKKFDYTAVAGRLRTVSWSNYGHPTGVVNLVYGPNLPTNHNSRVKKLQNLFTILNLFFYSDPASIFFYEWKNFTTLQNTHHGFMSSVF